ncbi:MAG TPA: hypothetical protein VIR29_06080 [Anseongella sp.]
MENYTDNELKEELQKRGYCTTALWHVDDVQSAIEKVNLNYGTNFTMSDAECMEILEGMFGADADFSAEMDMLEYAVFEHLKDRQDTPLQPHSRGR